VAQLLTGMLTIGPNAFSNAQNDTKLVLVISSHKLGYNTALRKAFD